LHGVTVAGGRGGGIFRGGIACRREMTPMRLENAERSGGERSNVLKFKEAKWKTTTNLWAIENTVWASTLEREEREVGFTIAKCKFS
jgi:hypothetical protein